MLLPVAMKDGRPVLISELPDENGGRCRGCVCPNCGGPLVAIRGPFQQPHFTHEHIDGSYDARDATPVGLLEMARRFLLDSGRIMLPGFDAVDESVDAYRGDPATHGVLTRRRTAAYPVMVSIRQARLERNPDEAIPRLLVETESGWVRIVLVVRRRAGRALRDLVADPETDTIEIDLSRTAYPDILDPDALRSLFVFNTVHKRWIPGTRFDEAVRELCDANRAVLKRIVE